MDEQRTIAELRKKIDFLKDIIKRAIPCAYHSKECSYTLDPLKICNCWVVDAFASITPEDKKPIPKLSVEPTTICVYCQDEFKYHTCKMGNKLGCSKVNCPCEDFK